MSKTVLQTKTAVLHKMREYSNAGVAQDDTDYALSMVPFINMYQGQIAKDAKNILKTVQISHHKPDNLLGKFNWNEELVHYDEDISYEALGALGYSLQIADYATVIIEESLDQVSYSTLYTITKTDVQLTVTDGVTPVVTTLDGTEGLITVKGKTNPTSSSYYVRIRFTGDYRYPYRWIALYSDNFYNDDKVPPFEPFVPYTLPSNFYAKKNVSLTFAYEQKLDLNTYRYELFDNSTKRIYFDWYTIGEFTIEYYAYPDAIPVPDAGDLTTSDAYELDLPDEAFMILVDLMASNLLKDENSYMSDGFQNSAYIGLNSNADQEDIDSGFRQVVDNSNW